LQLTVKSIVHLTAAGVEAIGYAGNGVYALRELQSDAGAPISANAVTALLASLISR